MQQDSSLLLIDHHDDNSSRSLRNKVTTTLTTSTTLSHYYLTHYYSVPNLQQPVIALLRDNLSTLLHNNLITLFGSVRLDNGSLTSNITTSIISTLIYILLLLTGCLQLLELLNLSLLNPVIKLNNNLLTTVIIFQSVESTGSMIFRYVTVSYLLPPLLTINRYTVI